MLHAFGGGQRIGAGGELDSHARHGLAVERGRSRIGLRTDFHPRDVAQPDAGTARVGAQDDAAELVFGFKAVLSGDGRGDLLSFLEGKGPERTARRLCILFTDRGDDRAGREVVGRELVRIEPDTHGVFGAEQGDIADPGHATQFVDDLRRGDVAQIGRV